MTMDVEAAQAEFLRKVYAPMFVEKLASLGVKIESEQDLVDAMETTAMLKLARLHANEQSGSPISQARDLLKSAMFGEDQAKQAAAADSGLQEATAALLSSLQQPRPEQKPEEQAA